MNINPVIHTEEAPLLYKGSLSKYSKSPPNDSTKKSAVALGALKESSRTQAAELPDSASALTKKAFKGMHSANSLPEGATPAKGGGGKARADFESLDVFNAEELPGALMMGLEDALLEIRPYSHVLQNGKILASNKENQVFTLDKFPGLVFKIGKSCRDRLKGYEASVKVCAKHHLDKVVLPKTRLFVQDGLTVVVQERLNIARAYIYPNQYDPSDKRLPADKTKDEAVKQATFYIFEVQHGDAHTENIVFLENSDKVAIIDFENTGKEHSAFCYWESLSEYHREIFMQEAQNCQPGYEPF